MHPYGPVFQRLLRLLRREEPLQARLQVRFTFGNPPDADDPCLGLHIVYYEDGDILSHIIYIRRGLSLDLALNTLLHEYAHALDNEENGVNSRISHRASWGRIYARLYNLHHGRH
jgi:hypothetical protein